MDRFNIGFEETLQMMEDGIALEQIKRVFQLMRETPESWTEDLSSLARIYKDAQGNDLNGWDPKNVRVGFMKC
jgi:hypothetical protein